MTLTRSCARAHGRCAPRSWRSSAAPRPPGPRPGIDRNHRSPDGLARPAPTRARQDSSQLLSHRRSVAVVVGRDGGRRERPVQARAAGRLPGGFRRRRTARRSGVGRRADHRRRQRAASDRRDVRVTARDRTAYGTRFNAAALELLPQSNGVYGLIERSDPLVITDRMEGGGTYPEPQRLGASGASWTQTTFKLGDADITDPDRTGFAMLYPNLDALEAVSAATAGDPSRHLRSGTAVTLVPRMPASKWHAHPAVRSLAAGVSVREPAARGRLDRAAAQLERRVVRRERARDPAARAPGGRQRSNEYTRLERERVADVAEPALGACRRTWSTRPSRATMCGSSRRPIGSRSRSTDGRCWSTRACSSANNRR